jgi:hypothetical protein
MASPLDIQPNAAEGKDTTLAMAWPNANSGIRTDMFINYASSVNDARVGLLAFDVSSIPSNVTITSASEKVYHYYGSVHFTCQLSRVLVSWIEGTKNLSTPAAGSNEPTWNHREYGVTAWGTAGCLGSGTDRAATASATASFHNDPLGWREFTGAGLVADYQGFVDGSLTNNGHLIWTSENNTGNSSNIYSSDYATDTTLRPKLYIEYTSSSIKTVNGLAIASVKTLRSGLLIASGKTFNGLA